MRGFNSASEKLALDAHITGHYGEDYFRRKQSADERSFVAGIEARIKDRPLTSCRCKTEKAQKAWKMGWRDQDQAILSEQEQPK